jgi:hypothetical protein
MIYRCHLLTRIWKLNIIFTRLHLLQLLVFSLFLLTSGQYN